MNYIITFLIGMVPLIELRGAVPYAIATGIPMWQALIIGVVANMLPVPIIFFFARRVLEWGANKPVIGGFFTWCLKKGHKGGKKLADTAGDKGIFIALLLFVGIPIPGTGAWTGTLAASILDWDFKRSITAVMLGVILAGLIMVTLTVLGLGALS
ncbi:COG2426 family protein [Streptococcus infantarius]|uniref:COG2426 family protein n=1 Tax=Streptococcus infantarius TaxID=102684 RepID=UPI00208E7371|nr:small multi-drug export protein [Streptococcus infantarius]MCO4465006.1 putative membrane protein [Streptococcus infantarius subsp. infantarius]MCO4472304.1 putative membrane protein [Streptococcus infantarius subsp. infantarius]MCO4479704.1 putative membrane protein [Streptococcus infantarius subsp. infantarius]MCO4482600.1 putative membrane protein [Streptococcus infantarius subsp. infantarius]MCO4485066.1 putative membrane protein [Streptococcus infantarius subsp. infantarius]